MFNTIISLIQSNYFRSRHSSSCKMMQRRSFHASSRSLRQFYDVTVNAREASTPIAFPANVHFTVHRIPNNHPLFPPKCHHGRFSYAELTENANGLRKFRESSVFYQQIQENTAVVEVQGPLGSGFVPVPEWCVAIFTVSECYFIISFFSRVYSYSHPAFCFSFPIYLSF
jgi:hypothetical protein